MDNTKEVRELFGLTDDSKVAELYEQAYHLYDSGKYLDASLLFRVLMAIDVTKPEYSMGLAGCFHLLGKYEPAIEIYNLVGTLDPLNPLPFYHMADCYIQLEESGMAIASLEVAIERSGNHPEHAPLKEAALLMIEGLKKKEGLSWVQK